MATLRMPISSETEETGCAILGASRPISGPHIEMSLLGSVIASVVPLIQVFNGMVDFQGTNL
jgi:hypothetical protein